MVLRKSLLNHISLPNAVMNIKYQITPAASWINLAGPR